MRVIRDAIICPFEGSMDSFRGGILDPESGFVEDCLCYRGTGPAFQKPVEYIAEPCVWGGMLFGHFGHFIWESLSRLVALQKCRNSPVLFISPNPVVYQWQQLFFRALGIHNRILLVRTPVLARQLVYCEPGISLSPLNISDEHLNAMVRFEGIEPDDRKIWLSRTGLKQGKAVNEPEIEAAIKDYGYEIVHPELLPIGQQIRLTASSRVVAGFDGSQFFSFLFASRPSGKFLIFNRRPWPAPTLHYSLDRKQIPHEVHTLEIENLDLDRDGNTIQCKALEIDRILDILERA